MTEFDYAIVREVFFAFCERYGLRLVPVDRRQFLLISPSYAIQVYAEPYGEALDVSYIDARDRADRDKMVVYSLGVFLSVKRPMPRPMRVKAYESEKERMRDWLEGIVENLMAKGEDILEGDATWIDEYPETWSVYLAPEPIQERIRELRRGEGHLGTEDGVGNL